jgi:hypothetical protein
MRGDTVIVRAFGGKALIRRVWGTGDGLVYITSNEEFEKLVAGKPAAEPIGFPKEDVFKNTATNSNETGVDWSRLQPWEA